MAGWKMECMVLQGNGRAKTRRDVNISDRQHESSGRKYMILSFLAVSCGKWLITDQCLSGLYGMG